MDIILIKETEKNLFDKSDVEVVKIKKELCKCQEREITHYVSIDYRIAGTTMTVGEFCKPCADEFADRIIGFLE